MAGATADIGDTRWRQTRLQTICQTLSCIALKLGHRVVALSSAGKRGLNFPIGLP